MKLFAGQFATKLMLFATYALALTAAVAVLLEIVLVWNVDGHGMVFELTEQERQGDEPPLDPALESLPQALLLRTRPGRRKQALRAMSVRTLTRDVRTSAISVSRHRTWPPAKDVTVWRSVFVSAGVLRSVQRA